MSTLRIAGALCAALLLSIAPASADELRLANGDRLTGTVVSLSSGVLTFKTPNGDLQVPWKDVTSLTTDRPLLVTREGSEPQMMALRGAAGISGGASSIVAIATPEPPIVWHGGASAGLLATGGNTDVNSLRLDGEATARTPRDRYTMSALVNRASDHSALTARNWTGSFAYDRFLSKRLFANGSIILTNDRFRDLDLRTAVGGGVGYEVWEAPMGTLSANGGLAWVRENFSTTPDTTYAAAHEAAKLDLLFLQKRVQAFHHHDGYFGLTGHDNLFFRMQNGVRLAIVAGLVSTAEVDTDYDRSPAPGRKHTDRTFSLTFGYRF